MRIVKLSGVLVLIGLILGTTGLVSWTELMIGLVVVCVGYMAYVGLLWLSPKAKDAHDKRAGKRNPFLLVGAIVAFTLFGYALERDFAPAEAVVALLFAATD